MHSLAAELGLPHVLSIISLQFTGGVFDSNSLRNVILSRYPFESVDEIGSTDYLESIGVVGTDGDPGPHERDDSRYAAAVIEFREPETQSPSSPCTPNQARGWTIAFGAPSNSSG